MPLDPSIILQAGRGVTPLKDQNEIASEQAQRQLQMMQLQSAKQGFADDQAYRQVLQSGATGTDQVSALQRAGLGKQSMEAQKFQSEQLKQQRETEKAQLESHLKKFELSGQIMNGVRDQATWENARQQTAQVFGPEAAAKLPLEYNPDLIAQNQARAISVKDQLEQKYKALTFGETQRHNITTEGLTAQGQGLTQRGQDMTDARSREQNAIRSQQGRIPSGFEPDPDKPGALRPISGGPADPLTKPAGGKPLNDTQAKALQFGSRMQASGEILDKLAESGVNSSVPGSELPVVGGFISALQPADRQQLDQAKRDFINAVLRRESGAAISESEFANAEKQYFAQPGDSEAVRAQKKANRELSTRGILAEVPDSEARVASVRGTPAGKAGDAPKGPQPKTKAVSVGGQDHMAELAPDGKYYVQKNGKWFEVR